MPSVQDLGLANLFGFVRGSTSSIGTGVDAHRPSSLCLRAQGIAERGESSRGTYLIEGDSPHVVHIVHSHNGGKQKVYRLVLKMLVVECFSRSRFGANATLFKVDPRARTSFPCGPSRILLIFPDFHLKCFII